MLEWGEWKPSPLALSWDDVHFRLPLQDQAQIYPLLDFCLRTQPYLAPPSCPAFFTPSLVSPRNISLINHLHMNLHVRVCSEEASLWPIHGYRHWHINGNTNCIHGYRRWHINGNANCVHAPVQELRNTPAPSSCSWAVNRHRRPWILPPRTPVRIGQSHEAELNLFCLHPWVICCNSLHL